MVANARVWVGEQGIAMSGFKWDDLRFFLELHRTGSFTAAGRRLKVSHTTVARHIDSLEHHLGVLLFERTDRGARLTDDGQRILNAAQSMEDLSEAIANEAEVSKPGLSGSVRIGAPDGFGNAFLSRVLPDLQKNHPALDLELVPVPVTHKLWKRDVDIAVSLDRPETGKIVMRKLIDYDLRLYGAPELLNEHGAPKSIDDLTAFNFVGYVDDLLYTDELDFNKSIHPELRIAYKGATVKAQLDAVRAGTGLGVLPVFMARDTDLVPLLTDQVRFQRTYWLLIPEEYRSLEKIKAVGQFIARTTAKQASVFRYD